MNFPESITRAAEIKLARLWSNLCSAYGILEDDGVISEDREPDPKVKKLAVERGASSATSGKE